MASRTKLSALLTLGALLAAWPVHAADAEASDSKTDAGDSATADADTAADDKADKPADDKGSKPAADTVPSDLNTTVEDPSKSYYFVGLRYRYIIVPEFILGMFADGGTTVGVHALGPEFGIRKAGFEYSVSAWWAGYYMDPTLFKAKSDPPTAWEIVQSKINVVYISADFLWSHDFTPELALNYGMGAGLGVVFGPLYRNQAYQGVNGKYEKCAAPNVPNPSYCDGSNDHYGNYQEKDWTGGGSKPTVFPWLALQTGLRYKPHRNFVARLDAGFGLSGFFVGLGADYGL